MRKLFAILFIATLGLTLTPNLNAAIDEDAWKFEPTVGPLIGIRNFNHRFGLHLKMGKENFSGLLSVAFGGTPKVLIRPAFVFDLPFYFTFADDEDFSIGPTFDVGPTFGFSGATTIDFFTVGFGARATYQFTDNFGIVAELIHFSMGFVQWVSGAGVNTNFVMSYDIKFGVFLLI